MTLRGVFCSWPSSIRPIGPELSLKVPHAHTSPSCRKQSDDRTESLLILINLACLGILLRYGCWSNLCEGGGVRVATTDHHRLAWQSHLGHNRGGQLAGGHKTKTFQMTHLAWKETVFFLFNMPAQRPFIVTAKGPNL